MLAKETLRRLILTFCDQKSSSVKCQILNLAFSIYENETCKKGAQSSRADEAQITEQMLRYVLKIAQLDENLIVKQKARFFSHAFEYRDSIDLSALTQEPDIAKQASHASGQQISSAAIVNFDLLEKAAGKTLAPATPQQV